MSEWVEQLLRLDKFTASAAGQIAGCYGPDAISRMRQNSRLDVEIVGEFRGKKNAKRKLYRVRLRQQRSVINE